MGLVAPQHVESSWTRDGTSAPYIGRWMLSTGPPGKFQNVTLCGVSLYKGHQVKMMPLGGALIQQDWCPYKRGNTLTGRMPHEHGDGYLQVKEKSLEQILLSQPQKKPVCSI